MRFEKSIRWESHASFNLSGQMRIIISSAFIQITFGLRKHRLRDFESIRVVARAYSYLWNEEFYHGDVNLSLSRITLAWPAVAKGFNIPDDSMNLCIHEFSHCLALQERVSIFYSFFNPVSWSYFKDIAHENLVRVKAGESKVLRKYGGTNWMEFFSVAMETFFENPKKMALHEPKIYQVLVRLLNQDPLGR